MLLFQTENRSPGGFPYSFLIVQRKFVFCLFVYEETNGSYPFANGRNGLFYLWLLLLKCNKTLLVTTISNSLYNLVTG